MYSRRIEVMDEIKAALEAISARLDGHDKLLDRLAIKAGLKEAPAFVSDWKPRDYSAQLAVPDEILKDMARGPGIDGRDGKVGWR
jgi:hypothetical protein